MADQLGAGHLGHDYVGDDQIEFLRVEHLDRLGAAGAGDRFVVEILERADSRGADARIVLDDQDAGAGDVDVGVSVRWTRRMDADRAPRPRCAADRSTPSCRAPTWLSIPTSPPDWCAKPKIWLRPRPVPLPTGLVVKKGSNARSSTSGGMPQPVSVTLIRT